MRFEENTTMRLAGETIGFVLAYAIFTTVLFLVLFFTKRALPITTVMLITAGIALLGYLIERWLR